MAAIFSYSMQKTEIISYFDNSEEACMWLILIIPSAFISCPIIGNRLTPNYSFDTVAVSYLHKYMNFYWSVPKIKVLLETMELYRTIRHFLYVTLHYMNLVTWLFLVKPWILFSRCVLFHFLVKQFNWRWTTFSVSDLSSSKYTKLFFCTPRTECLFNQLRNFYVDRSPIINNTKPL